MEKQLLKFYTTNTDRQIDILLLLYITEYNYPRKYLLNENKAQIDQYDPAVNEILKNKNKEITSWENLIFRRTDV